MLYKRAGFAGIEYAKQFRVPVDYKGVWLEADLRFDVMAEDSLLIELKAINGLFPIHEAVLLTYMRMLKKPKGILINFNCTNMFKCGQKTLVNELYAALLAE